MNMFYFLFTLFSVITIFTFWFAVSAFRENAFRAGILGLSLSLVMAFSIFFYALAENRGLLTSPLAQAIHFALGAIATLVTVLMFIPLGKNPKALAGTRGMIAGDPERFDQRDTAFNIAHVGGYGPEVAKQRWALQSMDPYNGIFWTLVMGLRSQVDSKVNLRKRKNFAMEEITKEIKKTAKYLGADLVGITTVKEDFTYSEAFSYEESKLEKGPAVTTPVDLKHRYVVVLGKEMDYWKVNTTLTDNNEENQGEVSKTYYQIAQIACSLAAYIRQLGYSARAHHLRNEEIFQVPHAIDAGLGEQGRHNYLISARYGPRVRLASVTTDLKLAEDRPVDIGVQDFCDICRLCETNCPSQALAPEKAVVRGYRKWPQEQQKCFSFWVSGANTFDCSLCLKICPWNKPPTFVHKVSFFAAPRSLLARRMLYWIAVLFYGRKVRWKRVPHRDEIEMPPETLAWNEGNG